ncbi:MAG: hypothetical protein P4L69_11910 [Desulfosporosinus sp.]|nr:hypothetical protein [Desulfosporosinus sp.]
MPTAKGIITTVSKAIGGSTVVCATAAVGVGLWLYEKTITNPLRVLYFVGPVWGNAPPEEICHSLTGVPAAWWMESVERQQACADLLERRFHSFDAGVMTCVYFTFLTFVILQLTFTCCCIRPLARALRRNND